MKKVLLIFLFFYTHCLQSQDCKYFLPFQVGKGVQYQTYNSRGKITGTVDYIIDSIASVDSLSIAFIKYLSLDLKGNEISVMEFKYKCNGTELRIDPISMISPELIEPYRDMDIQIDNEELIVPSLLTINQKLKDAACNIKIFEESRKLAEMNFKCQGRKIISLDSITTPLGVYPCYRISCETSLTVTTSMVPYIVEMNVNEFFSEGTGIIRIENFDRKGKLLGYSLLNKIY